MAETNSSSTFDRASSSGGSSSREISRSRSRSGSRSRSPWSTTSSARSRSRSRSRSRGRSSRSDNHHNHNTNHASTLDETEEEDGERKEVFQGDCKEAAIRVIRRKLGSVLNNNSWTDAAAQSFRDTNCVMTQTVQIKYEHATKPVHLDQFVVHEFAVYPAMRVGRIVFEPRVVPFTSATTSDDETMTIGIKIANRFEILDLLQFGGRDDPIVLKVQLNGRTVHKQISLEQYRETDLVFFNCATLKSRWLTQHSLCITLQRNTHRNMEAMKLECVSPESRMRSLEALLSYGNIKLFATASESVSNQDVEIKLLSKEQAAAKEAESAYLRCNLSCIVQLSEFVATLIARCQHEIAAVEVNITPRQLVAFMWWINSRQLLVGLDLADYFALLYVANYAFLNDFKRRIIDYINHSIHVSNVCDICEKYERISMTYKDGFEPVLLWIKENMRELKRSGKHGRFSRQIQQWISISN